MEDEVQSSRNAFRLLNTYVGRTIGTCATRIEVTDTFLARRGVSTRKDLDRGCASPHSRTRATLGTEFSRCSRQPRYESTA